MQLGHLLARSGLTYPEVSSKVYHDSFCQLAILFHYPGYTTKIQFIDSNGYWWQCLDPRAMKYRSFALCISADTRVSQIKTLNIFFIMDDMVCRYGVPIWCVDPWLISWCAAISFTDTRRFSFTMVSTLRLDLYIPGETPPPPNHPLSKTMLHVPQILCTLQQERISFPGRETSYNCSGVQSWPRHYSDWAISVQESMVHDSLKRNMLFRSQPSVDVACEHIR